MSFLKHYFKPEVKSAHKKANKGSESTLPSDSVPDGEATSASENGALSSRFDSRPASMYPQGDFREGRTHEAVVDIKYDVMVNWLQQQQMEYMWSSGGPQEGVVLKKRANQFVACPPDLADERGGLFDAIKLLNVKVSKCNRSLALVDTRSVQ